MPDILQDFPINAPPSRVFEAVSVPSGLDSWWTVRSAGIPKVGAAYELWFGPEYDWRGEVTRCTPNLEFELRMTRADADWTGTYVGFHLEEQAGRTWLAFRHTGWPSANQHFRISNHCWAMYLRILRRRLEYGESVDYEQRLNV
jgi:uncharacterized protein YndB with AHSA1/START domain